ncbi:MAG TPA: FlgD immunoglobulin-like domain containing protein [Candidatus Eisenbacteria bacterium]|jgi:hypothetical protein
MLAASLLPVKGQAGLRGAYDPITLGDPLIKAKFSPVLRGVPTRGAGSASSPKLEHWIAFVTGSQVFGFESTGEIYGQVNIDQAFAREFVPVALEVDPTAAVSYIDPAWSKDGKWFAYVQTDNFVSAASIYVQQFDIDPTLSVHGDKLGSPILVADGTGGKHHRHPAWNPSATQIAYDSDQFGSIDLWTVNVNLDATAHTGTVDEASRTRHQVGLDGDPGTLNGKAEFKPDYSPDGTKIAYVTNRFGAFQIQIVTLTSSGLGETSVSTETSPAPITHDNPSWSSDGLSLYYDAPANEDPANPQDIWKLDLPTGAKCGMSVDLAGDVDPDVSQYTNPTREGILFNYFLFISQASGFGVQVWRGEYVQNCVPPLQMSVVISPKQMSVGDSVGQFFPGTIEADLSFPPATIAAGYVCRAANQPNNSGLPEPTKEGIRVRKSIIPSPTMLGVTQKPIKDSGDCGDMDMLALLGVAHIPCFDPEPDPNLCFGVNCVFGDIGDYSVVVNSDGLNHHFIARYRKRHIANRLIALGLVDQLVALPVNAYSNRVGRQFLGFGYIRINSQTRGGAGSLVAMEQNSPNPFNPVTKFSFAINKPGNVSVRVFNTRGELVRTIVNQWFPQGQHEVSWDGKTASGGRAPSGIYFIKTDSNGASDMIKAVMAK